MIGARCSHVSFFLATQSFVTEAIIQAPPAAALAALDDLPAFMRLNPLVTDVTRDPAEADTYVITDRLRMIGLSFHIRYRARVVRVADGLDSEVWASPATHLHNELRILPEGAVARLRETVRMTAPRPLAGYAIANAQAAHRDLIDRFKARVEAGA